MVVLQFFPQNFVIFCQIICNFLPNNGRFFNIFLRIIFDAKINLEDGYGPKLNRILVSLEKEFFVRDDGRYGTGGREYVQPNG